MYNDYSYLAMTDSMSKTTSDALVAGGTMGALAGFLVTYSMIIMVIAVLTIIANWKIFSKAGEKGWKSIIPIYNTVTLFKIAGISPWWVLGYLAAIIPVIGGFVVLGITIYAMISLAKAFGKGGGFAAGLILLNTIFVMILAFGSAEYQLGKTQDANVTE